jgi:hypothetical protein
MIKDRWPDVKITCGRPRIPDDPGVRINVLAPRIVTERKIKELMKAHFGEPRAAQRAHTAHREWEVDNLRQKLFFEDQTTMNAAAKQWDAFERLVQAWNEGEQDRGIMHGSLLRRGVDFNGLHRQRDEGLER